MTDTPALLRVLEQVEQDGYALVDEELEAGLRSIAVPLRGHDDVTLADLVAVGTFHRLVMM